MSRFGQVGIALGTLGVMIAFMGLFPGVTGVAETIGIGVVQVFMLLTGYAMLVFGGLIYAKFTFYLDSKSNLAQQIGVRLTLTGLLFAALTGLADILGFGSHIRTSTGDIFFGGLQGLGTILSLTVSCFGVLLYTITGSPKISEEAMSDDLSTNPPRDTSEMKAVSEDSTSNSETTS
jgi:hypothetical protein